MTKRVEAIASPTNDARVVLKFWHQFIFTKYGTPRAIIRDEGTYFCNKMFDALLAKYGVKHKVFIAYHPQKKKKWSSRDFKSRNQANPREDGQHQPEGLGNTQVR